MNQKTEGGCRATGIKGVGLRAFGLVALLALWLPMACEAATPRKPQQSDEGEDTSLRCLPVRGTPADDGAFLRMAGPSIAGTGGLGPLQAHFYRLLGPGPAASDAAPKESTGNLMGDFIARPPPPLVRLLVDGSVDLAAGRQAQAEQRLGECAATAVRESDKLAEAACTNNLALLHALQGRLGPARTELEQVLQIYAAPIEPPSNLPPSPMLQGQGSLGNVLGALMAGAAPAQKEQMQARLKEAAATAWRRQAEVDVRQGRERTLLNLGNLEVAAARLDEAEKFFKRALESHGPEAPPACRAPAATDLARVYRRLGRGTDARNFAAFADQNRARPKKGEEEVGVLELGVLHLAPGGGANGARFEMAGGAQASPQSPPGPAGTTANFNEAGGRFDDGALARLQAEAARAEAPRAADTWQRLALRAAAARRPDLEFQAHAALMRDAATRGNGPLAVYHGKRAANLAQQTRAALEDRTPTREARRAFLRDRRQVYVALAQRLLDQQRLAEAEAVLQLLKEDEGQQFAEGSAAALGTLALNAPEQALQRQDEESTARLRRAEEARVAAPGKLPLGAGALLTLQRPAIEAQRLKLALALDGLADLLRRKPLTLPASDERVRALTLDLQDFFIGSGRRAEAFLARVLEDSAQFEPAPEAKVRTQLADLQKRLPRVLADAAPLLRNLPVEEGSGVRITTRRPGERSEAPQGVTDVRDFVASEPLEGLWRAMREGDAVEAAHLQQHAQVTLAAVPESASAKDEMLALLGAQPAPTALLYYLPGEDRLDALLVAANGRRHVRLAVARTELNSAIDDFAALLRDPDRDPRPAAQALYRRLFAPMEPALAASGARVLALALADRLRFVPFGALHDGQGWLVERYTLALHPGGRLAGRLKAASPQWRAAAFGATRGSGEFPPLPSVRGEVAAVVRQRDATAGALPGEAFLDQGFTAERLRGALAGNAQVLHIASHFKFSAGDAAGSYLLLGDGGRLSLKELAGPQYRFDRTELVTLSACATGLSADDAYGQEVDGLAALLMGQGAPSVLASLWEVNDLSTATLMATLYRLREGQKLSRAAALQQAQLAMIRAAAPTGPNASRGVARVPVPGETEPEPASAPQAALGQAHPFHWAAFVLMGNWR